MWRPRADVMRNMLPGSNLGLIATRQTTDKWDVLVTQFISGHKTCAAQDVNSLFPLYRYPSRQQVEQESYQPDARSPNLNGRFTNELAELLGLRFVDDGRGDLEHSFGPEDVFHYIYSVLHAPGYRERYEHFLRVDFPRIPPPNDVDQFRALAAFGRRLTSIHLLEPEALNDVDISYPVAGDNIVEPRHPIYVAPGERPIAEIEPLERGRVYIGSRGVRSQYFEGIAPEVWESRVGGYQPLRKWLQDRKGRELGYNDQLHYIHIAAALGETIRLTAAIDEIWSV